MRTTIKNNENAKGSLFYCLGRSMEIILDQFLLFVHMFCPHIFVVTIVILAFFKKGIKKCKKKILHKRI